MKPISVMVTASGAPGPAALLRAPKTTTGPNGNTEVWQDQKMRAGASAGAAERHPPAIEAGGSAGVGTSRQGKGASARGGWWRDPYSVVLALWCAAAATAVFLIESIDHSPAFFDPVEHFLDGIYLLHDPVRSYFLDRRANYPFLDSVLSIPVNLLDSNSYRATTACIGAMFLVGIIVATFLLARDLFGRVPGLVAAALVAVYPEIFGLSLTYMLDLGMAFMVVLAMLLLHRTAFFSRRDYSIALGFAVGLGTFTRYTFVLWMVVPLCGYLVSILTSRGLPASHRRSADENRKSRLANFLDMLLIATAIAVPWYAFRIRFLLGDYIVEQRRNNAGYGTNGSLFSLHALFYYPRALWHIASLPLSILFVVGALLLFFRSAAPKRLLALWLVGGYLAVTLLVRTDTRFFVSILPAVAIVTAGGLAKASRRAWRLWPGVWMLTAVFVAYGAVQIYGCLFGISWLPQGPRVGELVLPSDPLTLFSQDQASVPRVHRTAWSPFTVVRRLTAAAGPGVSSVKIVADTYATSALKLPIVRTTLLPGPTRFAFFQSGDPDFPADFVIVEVPSGATATRDALKQLRTTTSGLRLQYRLIYRERPAWPLAQQELLLFQRVS